MTLTVAQERAYVADLLDAVRDRAFRLGAHPADAALVLGRMAEAVILSVNAVAGLPKETSCLEWHKRLGKPSHVAHFKALDVVYAFRNAYGHVDNDVGDFRLSELEPHLESLAGVVRQLTRLLEGKGFAEKLYEVQQHLEAFARVPGLRKAIEVSGDYEAQLEGAMGFARQRLGADQLGRFQKIDLPHRLFAITHAVARLPVGAGSDPLRELVGQMVSSAPDAAPLRAWLESQPGPVVATPPKMMPVLAVRIESVDDGGRQAFELRWAGFVHPPMRHLDTGLGPLRFAGPGDFALAIATVTKRLMGAISARPEMDFRPDWDEVVLLLDVAPGHAALPFEGSAGRGLPLAQKFRGVAVRPRHVDNLGALPGDRRLRHPDTSPSNTVRFDQAVDPFEFYDRVRRKTASFVGAWGFEAEGDSAAVVHAFDRHPCAVAVAELPLDEALRRIFPNQEDVDLGALFDGVRGLRREHRVLLLWDPPEITPHLPEVLT